MKLYVGTSGYSYAEWSGGFYPPELRAAGYLSHYASRLPAVEINNTFYRLPKRDQLTKWANQVPDDFRFVLKASRRITHLSRLGNVEQPLGFLLRNVETLGERLGALLFQTPPYMRKDIDRLRKFLALVPATHRIALEFRHRSWLDEEVFSALREHGQALCIADGELNSGPENIVSTADWGYLRLRKSEYSDHELQQWLCGIGAQSWRQVYVFFKDEEAGVGPRLALRLGEFFARQPGAS